MHSPKLSQMIIRKEIKPNNEDSTCNNIIRIGLLIWAFMRLAVSLLWTGALVISTVGYLISPYAGELSFRLIFRLFAIIVQLVELAMLGTFIAAGLKKSVKFYLIYYRYCIVTLIIYIISVTICLSLSYERGHYFGDIYIFYNYYDVAGINGDGYLFFCIASTFDVGMEILLIFLIKKLINNYQIYGDNCTAGENI